MNKSVQKLLETFDDSKRVLAKLMATEDIIVQIVNGAPTASFDPVARVLTVPNWPNLTIDQTDLLLGHEVGHALFTNTSYIEKVVKTPGLMSFWNVIEDTRIERKMKDCFPGLKRIFYNAYESFHQNGPLFRGTRKGIFFDNPQTGRETLKTFAKMKFIDRINALYKIGAFVDIPFSENEQRWIDRINRCNSTEDAMVIAEALYKEQKEQNKQQKEDKKKQQQKGQKSNQQGQPSDSDDDADGDEESPSKSKSKDKKNADKKKSEKFESEKDGESDAADSDNDTDDEKSGDSSSDADDADESEENDSTMDASDNEDGDDSDSATDSDNEEENDEESGPQSNQVDFPEETDPTAMTDKQTQDVLKELAQQQDPRNTLRHVLIRPLTPAMTKDRTVTAMDWTKMTHEALGTSTEVEKVLQLLEQRWNAQFLATAKHMALEFERRKTAKTLSHAKIAKTGRLNFNKLSQYKFTDDLFNRVLNIPHGKSHGIVMTIDASGSMTNVFPHVLDQVLLFAHFAFQCQIPFEAYMFTDVHHGSLSYSYEAESMGPLTLTPSGAGRLVGLINTTDRRSFKQQVRAVVALRAHYSPEHDITRNYPGAASVIGTANGYSSATRIPFGRLGGTPLYIGLMLAERHVERMKRTLKLDKMTNVLITDGEDTNGLVYETPDANLRTGRISNKFQRYDASGLVVRDTVTKKNHVLVNTSGSGMNCPQNAMLTLLFDVIASRHDARNIMLFLAPDSSAASTINNSLGYLTRANENAGVTTTEIDKQLKNTHQFVMPKDKGVAELTIAVPSNELRLSENDFANSKTDKLSSAQVGKAFTAAAVKAVSNRIFVNTIMPFLA